MRNICFLNTTQFWGGGEKIHFDYGSKFRSRGYNVLFIASRKHQLYSKAKDANFSVFHFVLTNLSFLNPFKYLALVRYYKRAKIDTVIISTSHDTKVGALAARLAGVKRIVLYRALAAPVKNRRMNRYLYATVFTHVIANSQETRKKMLMHMDIIPERDVAIIYQGLDLPRIKEMEVKPLLIDNSKLIIGNAGRLTRQKGQQMFVDIAKHLKQNNLDFKIVIAGTGELKEELLQEIEKHELEDQIELLGFVDDVNSFMHSIDIFALTSEWEGFGYVLAEAMIANRPIVAYDITSNPELVKKGQNGYLVPFGDTTKFADRLLELAQDKDLRDKLGRNGKEFVETNFQLDHIIDQFENCLKLATTRSI